jgi:hypothetical protein
MRNNNKEFPPPSFDLIPLVVRDHSPPTMLMGSGHGLGKELQEAAGK